MPDRPYKKSPRAPRSPKGAVRGPRAPRDNDERGARPPRGPRPPREEGERTSRPPRGEFRGSRPSRDNDERGARPPRGPHPPREEGERASRPPRGEFRGVRPSRDNDERGARPPRGPRPPREEGERTSRPPRGEFRGARPSRDNDERGARPPRGPRPPREEGERTSRPPRIPRPSYREDDRGPRPPSDDEHGGRGSRGESRVKRSPRPENRDSRGRRDKGGEFSNATPDAPRRRPVASKPVSRRSPVSNRTVRASQRTAQRQGAEYVEVKPEIFEATVQLDAPTGVASTAKQVWRAGNMLCPVPAVLITTRDGEGNANIATIAWTGTVCSVPPMISIALQKSRKTFETVKATGQFVVNIPSIRQAKWVDYCGVVSGRDEDKFAKTGLTPAPAVQINPPIISECPINIECTVRQTIELGSHTLFIAEIIAVQVNESLIMPNGRLAIEKAGLIAFAHGGYFALGAHLGHFGYSVKKTKKKTRR